MTPPGRYSAQRACRTASLLLRASASSNPAAIADSQNAPGVTYRKSPATFRLSWFPFSMWKAPPNRRACLSNSRMRSTVEISASPRSRTSPNCTTVASSPTQRIPSASCAISPAMKRQSRSFWISPWTSPIARIRPVAVTRAFGPYVFTCFSAAGPSPAPSDGAASSPSSISSSYVSVATNTVLKDRELAASADAARICVCPLVPANTCE
mmetsp:Transcript_4367/g.12381  ORF Transcript_4367/g.12381 Transcript_4367/m.12381 type:complete len:210 (-) Transcript_4367:500-1129(-)